MMLLYLHGFRSSPASFKAALLAQRMVQRGQLDRWSCPALPASPTQALALAKSSARALIAQHDGTPEDLTIVGSSLGGFYAVCLAEQLGTRAIVINPAVYAPRDLATQVGEHRQYHTDEPFVFLTHYVNELQDMAVTQISHPDRYLLIAATGDEVLDWREMQAYFDGAHQIIVPGDNHGLSGFAQHIDTVLRFAGFKVGSPNQSES